MRERISRPIPIVIVTDCEPDPRQTTPAKREPWIGFERFFEFMSARRAALAARTRAPARFSWFWRMDPQIEVTYGSADWPLRTYARQAADAERAGDEAGLHTHAWRWDRGRDCWVADHGNTAWIEHCVRSSFAHFERAFGRTCRIFRFGDGFIDDAGLALIERLGARIDLTLEPGLAGQPSLVPEEVSTGSIPDRRAIPPRPYRPSRADFRKPDRDGTTRLWLLPVSTGAPPRSLQRPRSLRGVWKWVLAPAEPIQLNLGLAPEQFLPLFDRAVRSGKHPYAALCARSDLGTNAGLMAYVERNLDGMLRHRLADRFSFTTPTEALPMLID